jgi:OFA family oxalate/formate antiporter-like MFS transporter
MKNQGLSTVIAAVIIQLTLGVIYIWSVFQRGIADTIFGGDNVAAGLIMSLVIASMCVGCIPGGKVALKYSTRVSVFIGGLIMALGFFLASFVTADFAWALWLTYGVMGGFGMGFCYSTTISCAQRWYPHKKGMVTGIIVAGLGFGGVLFAPIIRFVITNFGGVGTGGEQVAFIVLSVAFLVVCSVGSLFLKDAPDGYMQTPPATGSAVTEAPKKNYKPLEMLKTPQFYLLTLTFILAVLGGVMYANYVMPIAEARDMAHIAVVGVMAVTISNSLGRLFWGAISDKLGTANTMIVLLAITAVLVLMFSVVVGYWNFVLFALVGFAYGGILSTFPPLTADTFGSKYMSANYGYVLQGLGIGSIVATSIAGYFKNIADATSDINQMFPAFIIASCAAVVGIVLMLVVKRMKLR